MLTANSTGNSTIYVQHRNIVIATGEHRVICNRFHYWSQDPLVWLLFICKYDQYPISESIAVTVLLLLLSHTHRKFGEREWIWVFRHSRQQQHTCINHEHFLHVEGLHHDSARANNQIWSMRLQWSMCCVWFSIMASIKCINMVWL